MVESQCANKIFKNSSQSQWFKFSLLTKNIFPSAKVGSLGTHNFLFRMDEMTKLAYRIKILTVFTLLASFCPLIYPEHKVLCSKDEQTSEIAKSQLSCRRVYGSVGFWLLFVWAKQIVVKNKRWNFLFLSLSIARKLSIYSHKVFLFFLFELFSNFYDRLKSHEVVLPSWCPIFISNFLKNHHYSI